MPVDTSIYATQNNKPIDIGGLINTAQSAQELMGKSAFEGIYKSATRPDGTVDPAILGRLGPLAGIYAPQVAQQAQHLTMGQQTIDHNKMSNLRQWWGTLDSKLYSMITDPDLSHDRVVKEINGLIGHNDSELNGGIFTPKMAVQAAKQFYGPKGEKLPPEEIRKKLAQFHVQVLDHLQASEPIDAGTAQPGNPYGLPPGTPMYRTRGGQIIHMATDPSGTASPAGGGGAVVPKGLGTGVGEAYSGVGTTSGTALGTDLARARNYRASVNPMERAISLLQTMKKEDIGPGTETVNHIKSFLQSMGFNPGKPWESVTKYNELKKYLVQWVNENGNQQNLETLHNAISGNPNMELDKASALNLSKVVLALRRQQHHQTAMFSQMLRAGAKDGAGRPYTPDRYLEWASTWNPTQDPRVYAFDMMPKDQQIKMMRELKEEGTWDSFKQSVQEIESLGIIRGPKR